MSLHQSPARPLVPQHTRPPRFGSSPESLRRSWFFATVLGQLAGFTAPALLGTVAFGAPAPLTWVLMVLAGAVEGALLGLGQALVLRRELLGFSRAAWIRATSVGAAAAWAAGMLPSTLYPLWSHWSLWVVLPLGVLLALAVVSAIGVAQWTVLRHHAARSRSWVPANALAWTAGLALCAAVTTPLWEEGQSPAVLMTIGLLGAVAMTSAVAEVTGLWLSRLLQPDVAERATPSGVPEEEWGALGASTDRFAVFDPNLLDGLPPPVARWVAHTISTGSALLSGASVTCEGHVRLGRSWRRFRSEQRATLGGGFVWAAHTQLGALPVAGYDRYTHDEGEMVWRILGGVRAATMAGEQVGRSAAGRHAAELLATVPAVALHPAVRWRPVDAQRAVARLVVGGEEQAVTVTVDALGRLRRVEMDRWGTPPGQPYGRYRFGALLGKERRFDGYLVPTDVVAGWHVGTARWQEGMFLRYRVLDCSFH